MKINKNFFLKVKGLYRTWKFNNHFSDVKYMWPFYDLRRIISNLVKYFGVVANDRPWDYQGWLTLTDKKFELLEKRLRVDGHHTNSEKDADNIHKTRLALRRIIDDNYHELALGPHDKKWGEIDMWFEELDEISDFDGEKMSQVHLDRANANTPELKEQERTEYRRLMKRPDYLKQQDLEYVTKMINKYLFHWWD